MSPAGGARARRPLGLSDEWDRIEALEEARDIDGLLGELTNELQVGSFRHEGEAFALTARGEAAVALGRLGDARALEPLLGLLNDPQVTVRSDAARALGMLGHRAAVPALTAALGDPLSAVRSFAARALGELDASAAAPALIELLTDENPRLVVQVAKVLAELGQPAAIEPIAATVRSTPPWHLWRRHQLKRCLRSLRANTLRAA